MCYSLNTFLALQEKPECRVILCGGEFHASNAIFKPLNLQDTLSNVCPDIAFYSAAGSLSVREQPALTGRVAGQALGIKRRAVPCAGGRSQQVWQGSSGKNGELSRFDAIVSDCRPDEETVAYAKAQQVKLMY